MLNLACHYTVISACSCLGEGQTDTFDAVTAMLTDVADDLGGAKAGIATDCAATDIEHPVGNVKFASRAPHTHSLLCIKLHL